MQITDKNVIPSLLNIFKNTVFTTRARVSSALQAAIEDSIILWLMTMLVAGLGEEGTLMGMIGFIFPKIQESKTNYFSKEI